MVAKMLKISGAGRELPTLAGPFTVSLDERPNVPTQHILRTINFKLYPTAKQAATLTRWLGKCCWLYNLCLEQRKKAYARRKESVSLYTQMKLLTVWRSRMEWLRIMPAWFARSSLMRVDRSMKEFFCRVKAGNAKAGFPRFKSCDRYRSMDFVESRKFIREKSVFVPGIGPVHARGRWDIQGKQKLLRIVRRASGWYAAIAVESKAEAKLTVGPDCGIDLGLKTFATLDSGEQVENPRTLRGAERKLAASQRKLARCQRSSNRRKKAKSVVGLIYERLQNSRRGFCHRTARMLVNRFGRIAIEDLNVKGLAGGRLAKSVNDAAWGQFIRTLQSKAESAGVAIVLVNPSGTSQECPQCGAVARKELSERNHCCQGCGFRCDRDHASAMVIRHRAFGSGRGGPASTNGETCRKAGPTNREGSITVLALR